MKCYQLSFVCLLFCSLFNSCKKQEEPKPVSIDSAFQSYVDTFLSEAAIRGQNIDLSKTGMTMQFGDGVVQGRTSKYWGITLPQSATIYINKSLWLNWRESTREQVIYHEMGHLLLKRDHFIKLWSNGEAQSLMFTPDESTALVFPLFQSMRKKYYFDELFNPTNQEEPEWCKIETTNTPLTNLSTQPIYQEDFNGKINLPDSITNKSNLKYLFSDGIMLISNIHTDFYSINLKNFLKNISFNKEQNYVIKYRFRHNGAVSGGINWNNFNSTSNAYFFRFNTSNQAIIYTNSESYFYNPLVKSVFGDWNDFVLRYEDSMINVWLNDKLLFKSDVVLPVNSDSWRFELHVPQKTVLEIDYIKIYRL